MAGAGTAVADVGSAGTSLPAWSSDYDWQAGSGYFGWSPSGPGIDVAAYAFARGLTADPGLWLWPSGGSYAPGVAEWAYPAPGTTRLLKATARLAYPPRLLSHHCVRAVLQDASGAERDATTFCKPPQPPAANPATVTLSLADPTPSDPRSTRLSLGIELPCAAPNPDSCTKTIPVATAVTDSRSAASR
jgi:hypothetical protein